MSESLNYEQRQAENIQTGGEPLGTIQGKQGKLLANLPKGKGGYRPQQESLNQQSEISHAKSTGRSRNREPRRISEYREDAFPPLLPIADRPVSEYSASEAENWDVLHPKDCSSLEQSPTASEIPPPPPPSPKDGDIVAHERTNSIDQQSLSSSLSRITMSIQSDQSRKLSSMNVSLPLSGTLSYSSQSSHRSIFTPDNLTQAQEAVQKQEQRVHRTMERTVRSRQKLVPLMPIEEQWKLVEGDEKVIDEKARLEKLRKIETVYQETVARVSSRATLSGLDSPESALINEMIVELEARKTISEMFDVPSGESCRCKRDHSSISDENTSHGSDRFCKRHKKDNSIRTQGTNNREILNVRTPPNLIPLEDGKVITTSKKTDKHSPLPIEDVPMCAPPIKDVVKDLLKQLVEVSKDPTVPPVEVQHFDIKTPENSVVKEQDSHAFSGGSSGTCLSTIKDKRNSQKRSEPYGNRKNYSEINYSTLEPGRSLISLDSTARFAAGSLRPENVIDEDMSIVGIDHIKTQISLEPIPFALDSPSWALIRSDPGALVQQNWNASVPVQLPSTPNALMGISPSSYQSRTESRSRLGSEMGSIPMIPKPRSQKQSTTKSGVDSRHTNILGGTSSDNAMVLTSVENQSNKSSLISSFNSPKSTISSEKFSPKKSSRLGSSARTIPTVDGHFIPSPKPTTKVSTSSEGSEIGAPRPERTASDIERFPYKYCRHSEFNDVTGPCRKSQFQSKWSPKIDPRLSITSEKSPSKIPNPKTSEPTGFLDPKCEHSECTNAPGPSMGAESFRPSNQSNIKSDAHAEVYESLRQIRNQLRNHQEDKISKDGGSMFTTNQMGNEYTNQANKSSQLSTPRETIQSSGIHRIGAFNMSREGQHQLSGGQSVFGTVPSIFGSTTGTPDFPQPTNQRFMHSESKSNLGFRPPQYESISSTHVGQAQSSRMGHHLDSSRRNHQGLTATTNFGDPISNNVSTSFWGTPGRSMASQVSSRNFGHYTASNVGTTVGGNLSVGGRSAKATTSGDQKIGELDTRSNLSIIKIMKDAKAGKLHEQGKVDTPGKPKSGIDPLPQSRHTVTDPPKTSRQIDRYLRQQIELGVQAELNKLGKSSLPHSMGGGNTINITGQSHTPIADRQNVNIGTDNPALPSDHHQINIGAGNTISIADYPQEPIGPPKRKHDSHFKSFYSNNSTIRDRGDRYFLKANADLPQSWYDVGLRYNLFQTSLDQVDKWVADLDSQVALFGTTTTSNFKVENQGYFVDGRNNQFLFVRLRDDTLNLPPPGLVGQEDFRECNYVLENLKMKVIQEMAATTHQLYRADYYHGSLIIDLVLGKPKETKFNGEKFTLNTPTFEAHEPRRPDKSLVDQRDEDARYQKYEVERASRRLYYSSVALDKWPAISKLTHFEGLITTCANYIAQNAAIQAKVEPFKSDIIANKKKSFDLYLLQFEEEYAKYIGYNQESVRKAATRALQDLHYDKTKLPSDAIQHYLSQIRAIFARCRAVGNQAYCLAEEEFEPGNPIFDKEMDRLAEYKLLYSQITIESLGKVTNLKQLFKLLEELAKNRNLWSHKMAVLPNFLTGDLYTGGRSDETPSFRNDQRVLMNAIRRNGKGDFCGTCFMDRREFQHNEATCLYAREQGEGRRRNSRNQSPRLAAVEDPLFYQEPDSQFAGYTEFPRRNSAGPNSSFSGRRDSKGKGKGKGGDRRESWGSLGRGGPSPSSNSATKGGGNPNKKKRQYFTAEEDQCKSITHNTKHHFIINRNIFRYGQEMKVNVKEIPYGKCPNKGCPINNCLQVQKTNKFWKNGMLCPHWYVLVEGWTLAKETKGPGYCQCKKAKSPPSK